MEKEISNDYFGNKKAATQVFFNIDKIKVQDGHTHYLVKNVCMKQPVKILL